MSDLNFRSLDRVSFPEPGGLSLNMLPIRMGDPATVPGEAQGYLSVIGACDLAPGSTVYLSVSECLVREGQLQRRPGVHTEGTNALGWGGGWGGTKAGEGIYMASTDGDCAVWDLMTHEVDGHGALVSEPGGVRLRMNPHRLYWLTDRTPHEALPATCTHYRQWFRLVADRIGGWWEQHSTPSPFGIQPNAPILTGSKFA